MFAFSLPVVLSLIAGGLFTGCLLFGIFGFPLLCSMPCGVGIRCYVYYCILYFVVITLV